MKEVSEYWQMRIFDLLEGNLSEIDKQDVLREIEKEDLLKREFALLQRTYLQTEPLVFEKKSTLYHKEGGALTFIFSRKFAAAAAIAIIFGSISIFWLASNKNQKIGNEMVQDKTQKNLPLAETEAKNGTSNSKLIPAVSSNKKTIFPFQKAETKEIFTQPKIEYAPVHISDPEFTNVVKNNIIIDTIPAEIITKNDVIISPNIDSNEIAETSVGPIKFSKKRSLGYKLLNNSRVMLASLQMPNIKFKTEKKAHHFIPKVKMEIHTPKTEIIATLID